MQTVYTLAIDKPFNLQPLEGLGLMTLDCAEYWRGVAISMRQPCLVVNLKTLKGF
jgi:hypothetical protein